MTQEDKELLLKDLCVRLPYGVIVDYKKNEFEIPHEVMSDEEIKEMVHELNLIARCRIIPRA